ncbi:MAG: flagellar hook-associated protein FlgK [Armatimonadetes bacterium]|nr:flagellar hook-associated protein FlgK [Armatimonadota bacterium]
MPSAFSGIEMGRRALSAHQQAIDVTGHNIANINTPGYSRQEIVFATTDPYTNPSVRMDLTKGQFGTGVMVQAIRRVRAGYLDGRARDSMSRYGAQTQKSDWLSQAENAFREPGDSGLNAALSRFASAWQNVSKDAQNGGTRAVLIEQAQSFANDINSLANRLDRMAQDADSLIAGKLQEANDLTGRIASLNGEIKKVMAIGQEPNDLRDNRDRLLDRLAELTDFVQTDRADGMVTVSIGGTNVVLDDRNTVLIASSGIASGEIGGIGEAKASIQARRAEIGTLAARIVQDVNTQHRAGFDLDGNAGGDFFTAVPGNEAATMAVSADLTADPRKLAAAETIASAGPPPLPVPGDGDNALKIARLQEQKGMNGGTQTYGEYYTQTVSRLGAESRTALDGLDGEKAYLDALSQQRESVSGVSLDEETLNLIRFQRGYEAAARLVSTMDEMLDTIINGLGTR